MNKFISNSQHADDYIAWQLLGKKANGIVIEVGAFDGKHLSNSYGLSQLGWKSICIEPNPIIFKYLIKNRPDAVNINKAIVGDENIFEIEFFSEEIGVLSGCTYDDEDIKRRYKNRGLEYNEPKKIVVQAITLNTLCDTLKINDIDLLSIDVEGFELEVLKGFSLSKFKVNLFIIEANNQKDKDAILNFFKPYSEYVFIGNNFQNLFFMRKNAIKKRYLRNLDYSNYIKAKQCHPVDEKFVIDSVSPEFVKSSECIQIQKYLFVL